MMAMGSPGRGLSGARWVGRAGAEGTATVGPGWNVGAGIVLAGVGSGSLRAGAARGGAGACAGGAGGSVAPDDAVPLLVVLAAGAGRRSGSVTPRATGVVPPVRPGDAAESAVGAGGGGETGGVVLPVRPGDAAESAVGAGGGGETGGVGRTGGWRPASWLEGRLLDMPELEGGTTGAGLGTTGAEGAVTTTAECTGTGTGRGVLRLGYRWNQARTALPTTTIGRPASAQDRADGRLGGRAGEAAVAGGEATSRGAASASARRWHAASQRSFRIEVGSVGLRMGSRSSILETRPSTAFGSPGRRSRSFLSGDRSCRSRTSPDVVPSNGTLPHRSSWRRTPNR
jgi:hypothetical protein